jgi:hypothetical protein
MKATLILADSTSGDPGGKLHALGLGWNSTTTPQPPFGIAVIIDCAWDQTNAQHHMVIELVDADGQVVSVQQGPLGDPIPAVRIEADFEIGRPPGHPHGSPIRQLIPINSTGGLPLAPGQYEFKLTIDGELFDSWLSTFTIRA